MAEIELSILSRQCLGKKRFGTSAVMDAEIAAWATSRNKKQCGTSWRFTTEDARIKLQSLYPQPDN